MLLNKGRFLIFLIYIINLSYFITYLYKLLYNLKFNNKLFISNIIYKLIVL